MTAFPGCRHARIGFTLIEVLIVVALIASFAALVLFVSIDFYRSFALEAERDQFVALARKARQEAQDNIRGVPHGVRVESDRFVAFSGASYAGRDPVWDEPVMRSPGLAANGLSEVVFGQLSATSSASGTIALSGGNHARAIEINYEGRILWY